MSETQALLARIKALRQRLDQGRGLSEAAAHASERLGDGQPAPPHSVAALEQRVAEQGQHDLLLDGIVRAAVATADDFRPLPRLLTARARRVLEWARDLLGRLRVVSDAFAPPYVDPANPATEISGSGQLDYNDPLSRHYRETAAIIETALRLVPILPDSAAGQLHLCEGLEGVLGLASRRVDILDAAVAHHRQEIERIDRLAELLGGVAKGERKSWQALLDLAGEIQQEADEGTALHWLPCDAGRPAHFAAAHGLTTARVMARVVKYDDELRGRRLDAVTSALVHDIGLLRVPVEVLGKAGPLEDDQKRIIESHCRFGAQMLAPLGDEAGWAAEAAAGHHERLDGTGYPDGLRGHHLSSLVRLLMVCDCYVGMASARPHRPARETRTALADTLLLADQGLIDRRHAEHLLQLSFYPVGCAVELADGSIGVVAATPHAQRDLNAPARPVVALLFDAAGQPLVVPRHVDLLQAEQHCIVRTLGERERRERLGGRFPEWLAA